MAQSLSLKYVHCSLRISVLSLFATISAGVVPRGGPEKSLRTSSIVQIIFFFPFGPLSSARVF